MIYANVFLYSEMDENGDIIPMQYPLTHEEVETVHYMVENNLKIIAFGNHFHNAEDIIKFDIVHSDDLPFKNM